MKKIITSLAILMILVSNVAISSQMPDINAEFAITVDANTGNIIYYKNGDTKAYPASITKLMSALILDESKKKEDTLIYTQMAKNQPSSSINRDFLRVAVGTPIDVDTILKSMLIVSANDMTTTVATNIPVYNDTNATEFAKIMNKKAKEFGMKNTNFVTSNGIDNYTNEHLSTPYDISILARKAFDNQSIASDAKLENVDITIAQTTFNIKNSNKFMRKDTPFYDETCIGGKTGYTDKAGRCLTTIFERDGKEIVGVVLKSKKNGSDSMVFEDMKKIIDYSFEAEENYYNYFDEYSNKTVELKKGEVVRIIPVKYKMFKYFGSEKVIDVPLILDNDIKYYKNEVNDKEAKIEFKTEGDLFTRTSNDVFGYINLSFREATIGSTLTTDITFKDIYMQNVLVYTIILISLLLILYVIISKIVRKLFRRR